jgi:hypothetical protein
MTTQPGSAIPSRSAPPAAAARSTIAPDLLSRSQALTQRLPQTSRSPQYVPTCAICGSKLEFTDRPRCC